MILPGRGRVLSLSGADTVLTHTPTAQELLALLADDARRVAVVTRDGAGVLAVTELATLATLDRRTPPDASDLAVWTLNDTSGDFLNTGAAGTAGDLAPTGTLTRGIAGVFDRAVSFGGGYARGAQVIEPANAITLSAWVYVSAYPTGLPTNYTRIVGRPLNNFADPYMSADITLNNNGTFAATVNRNVPGTGAYVLSDPAILPLSTWHHVGMSFDGATLALYLDGATIASLARALTIAYTQGPNDVWAIAGNPAVPVFESRLQGRVDDVRIANVARSADWFREVWQRGVGWGF